MDVVCSICCEKRYDKEDSKDKIYEKELKSFDGTTIMR